jgi:hypothetical protein
LAASSAAQDRASEVATAFARALHIRHGINASEWFAQSGDYSAARIGRYTDSSDIVLIARLGFDHVRLPVDGAALEQNPRGADGLNDEFLSRLDGAVDTILANGLAVVVDLHAEDSFKQPLATSDDAVDRLVMLWRRLAAHYAGRDPDRLFFEILNEPGMSDSYRWAGIQQRLAAVIRKAAPHHTLIATGGSYSSIRDLLALEPLADGNVLYTFHFYEPHAFTHQGATWGVAWWSYIHRIPYPPSAGSMHDLLAQVPDEADRAALEDYWLDGWNGNRIRALIDEAAAWAAERKVPLYCGEFGAYRNYADSVSRASWLHDTRTALEADGIGWAMWDYRGGFGVVSKQDGQPAQADRAIVDALGLKEK